MLKQDPEDLEKYQRELLVGLLEKQIKTPIYCKKHPGRFSRHWSCGTLFNCSATPAQIWSSWKNHQKKTSHVSSPQSSAS